MDERLTLIPITIRVSVQRSTSGRYTLEVYSIALSTHLLLTVTYLMKCAGGTENLIV